MASTALAALKTLSAKLGSNPLLVQAAGGNTSLKSDDTMWIKASGTWLKNAENQDIFVPLNLLALGKALQNDSPACESCTDFVRHEINASGLRPSIETSVHGLMPQKVVLHVHCVNTISIAIRKNAEALLATALQGFNWTFVPYARPGLDLSRAIRNAITLNTNVLVLENHGLVVAAASVAEAERLLEKVTKALQRPRRKIATANLEKLMRIAEGTNYRVPLDDGCHSFAMDRTMCKLASENVYYPDHAVFIGQQIPKDFSANPPAIAIPGAGVLVHKAAKLAVEPMLRCLSDVFARLDAKAKLKALSTQEVAALMDWDAEKYRQGMRLQ